VRRLDAALALNRHCFAVRRGIGFRHEFEYSLYVSPCDLRVTQVTAVASNFPGASSRTAPHHPVVARIEKESCDKSQHSKT
jgi:hypothetical protein